MLETIIEEKIGKVGLIRLNRPQALNAINNQMTEEILSTLVTFDEDPEIGCIVITGSGKAFAAGADIKEMLPCSYMDMNQLDTFAEWDVLTAIRKPIIAAVHGPALGGGCELAMMCDFILAGNSARFGQPEIRLGIMPGMGGSQRLTRLIGRCKAMEMCLTGRMMDAVEAERCGLVVRIIPDEDLEKAAIALAGQIASYPSHVVAIIKEAVNCNDSMPLAEGLRFERRLMHSLFATEDQKEGMSAFIEKRAANFKNR